MARSLRSSTKKSNRAKLRREVFSPVEMARTERLSNKLLQLATQPRPKAREGLEIAQEKNEDFRVTNDEADPTTSSFLAMEAEMELDGTPAITKVATQSSSKSKHTPKRRRGKPNATMTFPARQKRKRVDFKKTIKEMHCQT